NNPDGNGYRTKQIEPYWEDVTEFQKDGKAVYHAHIPMRIEMHEGMRHFYSLHGQGPWHSTYAVQDGKWYEQFRGMFITGSDMKPNEFFVYDKVSGPQATDTSSASGGSSAKLAPELRKMEWQLGTWAADTDNPKGKWQVSFTPSLNGKMI